MANGPHQWSGTSFQLVARKYRRPPINPAGTPQIATSCGSVGSPPCAFQRRLVIITAATIATT